jgi:hypothetical protein
MTLAAMIAARVIAAWIAANTAAVLLLERNRNCRSRKGAQQ